MKTCLDPNGMSILCKPFMRRYFCPRTQKYHKIDFHTHHLEKTIVRFQDCDCIYAYEPVYHLSHFDNNKN